MTMHMIEGFDYLAADPPTNILAALGWTGDIDGLITTTNTAFGYGRAMTFSTTGNNTRLYRYLRGRHTGQYAMGMRMFVPTTGDAYNIRAWDANSTENEQWLLRFDMFGAIWLYSYINGNTSLIAKAGNDAFVPGTWFWLEFKVTPATSGGTFELRINTVPVFSLSNVRTADGNLIAPAVARGISHMQFHLSRLDSVTPWSNDWRMDDMYFLTVGGADNTDFIGNVRVKYMALVSDDTPQDFVRVGAASNWQAASNANMNDAAYIYSPTLGANSLFNVNPNLNTPLVYAIEISGAYRQDDATQRFVTHTLKSGATTVDGDNHPINQSYTFYFDLYERNPDTGLQFTGAEANAVKIGPKITT